MSAWGSTLRQPAEVALAGGRTVRGEIHLQPRAEWHLGPESPEDMLNREERFFALTVTGEAPLLIAKTQVMVVTVPEVMAGSDPQRASAARSLALRVELSDGSSHDGIVTLELPPDRARPLDFLNFAPGFFSLHAADAVLLINRAHIRTATPIT